MAKSSYGCVSGAGKSGVMGAVVRGAVDAEGWTGGSNVPHIIRLEGLPEVDQQKYAQSIDEQTFQ